MILASPPTPRGHRFRAGELQEKPVLIQPGSQNSVSRCSCLSLPAARSEKWLSIAPKKGKNNSRRHVFASPAAAVESSLSPQLNDRPAAWTNGGLSAELRLVFFSNAPGLEMLLLAVERTAAALVDQPAAHLAAPTVGTAYPCRCQCVCCGRVPADQRAAARRPRCCWSSPQIDWTSR